MITPQNLVRHELIGLKARVADSSDKKIIGLEGRVVDEIRNISGTHAFITPTLNYLHVKRPNTAFYSIEVR